jgi:hypothetical protein
MKRHVSISLVSVALAVCSAALLACCQEGDVSGSVRPVLSQAAPGAKQTMEKASPNIEEEELPAAASSEQGKANAEAGADCLYKATCQRRCESECATAERDRTAFYEAKRASTSSSPFAVQIERVFYSGMCPVGDVPSMREPTVGLKAIVEGVLTYNGDDVIYSAELDGAAFFRFGDSEYTEAPALGRSYANAWSVKTKELSRVLRAVHGSDPWGKGESRPFHWESTPFSEVFCEASPREAGAYIALDVLGVRGGRSEIPVAVVPMRPEEILGMAVRQQVKIRTPKGNDFDEETADAHFSKLDRVLVTRLTGTTEWIKRTMIVQSDLFKKGSATTFPSEASSAAWKVSVTAVNDVRSFGGFKCQGDDQLFAVLDLTITNQAGEGASLSGLAPRLEVEPGNWLKPMEKALDQIDLSREVAMGASVSGKLAFLHQRFQRPFRLEVKTPDGTTLYVDALSYDIGASTGP